MTSHGRREDVSLWIGQVILAVIFLTASYVKTSTPVGDLNLALPWTADLPTIMVRAIGVAEGLGGLGLLLPSLLRRRPTLTPLAAWAVTALMGCAAVFHLIRGELRSVGGVVLLGVLAAGIAVGRSRHAPIEERADDDYDGE